MDRILINGFYIPVLPQLTYFKDGEDAKTVLFIEDPNEQFLIAFQEGMECIDLIVEDTDMHKYIHSEYTQNNRYLHQCKRNPQKSIRKRSKKKRNNMVYFHMEIQDENGAVHVCPGQMSVSHNCLQEHNIDQVLIKLLNGSTVMEN